MIMLWVIGFLFTGGLLSVEDFWETLRLFLLWPFDLGHATADCVRGVMILMKKRNGEGGK